LTFCPDKTASSHESTFQTGQRPSRRGPTRGTRRVGFPALAATTGIPESSARCRLTELCHDGVLYEHSAPPYIFTIVVA
jgi:hypothetical protein